MAGDRPRGRAGYRAVVADQDACTSCERPQLYAQDPDAVRPIRDDIDGPVRRLLAELTGQQAADIRA